MLRIIDRYLLREVITHCVVITGIGLAILLLERVLRLFALVASPNKAFVYVGQMLVFLMPHYLSIALPAAFFFAVLLVFLRLRQDSELYVLMAQGQSLGRLLLPLMGMALVLTLITVAIVGYLNPHARYAYRSLKHTVANASLTAAVLEGTFIHANDLTFFAERSLPGSDGLRLDKVFVFEEKPDGTLVIVTGSDGLLGQTGEDGYPILYLQQGVRAEIPAGDGMASSLTFSDLSWPVTTEAVGRFRPRGNDQRELTLDELWTADATATSKPNAAEIASELTARLVLIGSVPFLPLLAVALATSGTQRTRRSGIVVGLLVLVFYYQSLNFGQALAKRGLVTPLLGEWLPFLLFAGVATYLFHRAFFGRPFIPTLSALSGRLPALGSAR